MSRLFKAEAIVLRKRSILNEDIIITLFTDCWGKINVFAKGVKKITSRRLSHIQTGNLIKGLFYKKEDRFYLQETYLVSAFSQIKKESSRLNCLYFILFVLERLTSENQRESKLYLLVKKFLIDLSLSKANCQVIVEKYLNQILIILGFIGKEKTLAELKLIIEKIIEEKLPYFDI